MGKKKGQPEKRLTKAERDTELRAQLNAQIRRSSRMQKAAMKAFEKGLEAIWEMQERNERGRHELTARIKALQDEVERNQ